MPLVNQPTMAPTNKLTVSAIIGPAVAEAWGGVMSTLYPALAGPEMSLLAGTLAALAIGYLVPDRANVVQE